MSGISHYRPKVRGKQELRFDLHHNARTARWCYRRIRKAGLDSFSARCVVVDLLRAGQFATLVEFEAKP